MVLSGQTIRQRNIINPFHDRTEAFGFTYGVGPAGYDVRIDQNVIIPPGGFTLASTMEYFHMPNDVLGIVHDKSTWARRGLAAQNTVIEPGWRGWLTLELTNHLSPDSGEDIELQKGMPIVQIIFHLVDQAVENPYYGKYQDQPRGPVPAKY